MSAERQEDRCAEVAAKRTVGPNRKDVAAALFNEHLDLAAICKALGQPLHPVIPARHERARPLLAGGEAAQRFSTENHPPSLETNSLRTSSSVEESGDWKEDRLPSSAPRPARRSRLH